MCPDWKKNARVETERQSPGWNKSSLEHQVLTIGWESSKWLHLDQSALHFCYALLAAGCPQSWGWWRTGAALLGFFSTDPTVSQPHARRGSMIGKFPNYPEVKYPFPCLTLLPFSYLMACSSLNKWVILAHFWTTARGRIWRWMAYHSSCWDKSSISDFRWEKDHVWNPPSQSKVFLTFEGTPLGSVNVTFLHLPHLLSNSCTVHMALACCYTCACALLVLGLMFGFYPQKC